MSHHCITQILMHHRFWASWWKTAFESAQVRLRCTSQHTAPSHIADRTLAACALEVAVVAMTVCRRCEKSDI
jgi:hypothetical protein